MEVNVIFAYAGLIDSELKGFGKDNDLIVRCSEDLKNFKTLTSGYPIIMGRKTFESLGSKALPNRVSVVVSSIPYNEWVEVPDCIKMPSLEAAITYCKQGLLAEKCFIIGGSSLIETTLEKYADKAYISAFKKEISIEETDVQISLDMLKYFQQTSNTEYTNFALQTFERVKGEQ